MNRGESGLPETEQESHERRTEQFWRDLKENSSPFSAQAGRYAASHPSPAYRAEAEQAGRKGAAQAKPKPAPNFKIDDEIEARAAHDRANEEYVAWANEQDAAIDSQTDGDKSE